VVVQLFKDIQLQNYCAENTDLSTAEAETKPDQQSMFIGYLWEVLLS
jgi:hypothetical protein